MTYKKVFDEHEGESFLVSDPNVKLDYEALVHDDSLDDLIEPLLIPIPIIEKAPLSIQGSLVLLKFLVSEPHHRVPMEMETLLLSLEHTNTSSLIKIKVSLLLEDAFKFNTALISKTLKLDSLYSKPKLWQGEYQISRLHIKDIKKNNCILELDLSKT